MKGSRIVIVMVTLAPHLLDAERITNANYEILKVRYESEWQYPSSSLASNIYAQVWHIYDSASESPFDYFLSARGGGVDNELQTPEFFAYCAFVSNHCDEIIADWPTYETNEMVRFTTLSAIGCSGYDNLTNLMETVLSHYMVDTNYCGWETIRFINSPFGTTGRWYNVLHYDDPLVSNNLECIKTIALNLGKTNVVEWCNERLSGALKIEIMEGIEAGILK